MVSFTDISEKLIENMEKVVVGKRSVIELVLAALFSEGHVLIEDVPGVAKTMLARALAGSIGCGFSRIQCTPDLLPTDITGVSIYNQKISEFEFKPGPIFAEVVLADEINRATPRTQSALLEAMAERQVTVDGATYQLKQPFMVMATQNPVEYEGTFPLPEAQLDRFLLKLSVGYPGSIVEEDRIIQQHNKGNPVDSLEPVVSARDIVKMQNVTREVFVHEKVRRYLLSIVNATRAHASILLGASPRASIAWYRVTKAFAAIQGRNYVLPDDVKRLAVPVLEHRIIPRPETALRKRTTKMIINEILEKQRVPVGGASWSGRE